MRIRTTSTTCAETIEPALPTSRHATHQERSVLAVLRSKAPRRALLPLEAEQIAEWQATALLTMAGLQAPPTPTSLISQLPRVLVRAQPDVPASACSDWHSGRWLIWINSSEPATRQIFSLFHEYKHVIDHPQRALLYQGDHARSEAAADYFAACLLMPRAWMKHAWVAGHQTVGDLAELFQVHPRAMARRLAHLGLGATRIAADGERMRAGRSDT